MLAEEWVASAELADVARAWLAGGARAFGVWHGDEVVRGWPDGPVFAAAVAEPTDLVVASIGGVDGD